MKKLKLFDPASPVFFSQCSVWVLSPDKRGEKRKKFFSAQKKNLFRTFPGVRRLSPAAAPPPPEGEEKTHPRWENLLDRVPDCGNDDSVTLLGHWMHLCVSLILMQVWKTLR